MSAAKPIRKKKKDRPFLAPIVAHATVDPYCADIEIVFLPDIAVAAEHYGINSERVAGRAGFYIYLPDSDKHLLAFSTIGLTYGGIAHEALHCTFGIMRQIGQALEGGEEATAYLHQHVVDCCITAAVKKEFYISPAPGL